MVAEGGLDKITEQQGDCRIAFLDVSENAGWLSGRGTEPYRIAHCIMAHHVGSLPRLRKKN